MQEVKFVIDVTQISKYLLKSQVSTGVQRVALSYIAQYGKLSYAMYKGRIFSWKDSQELFEHLLTTSSRHKASSLIRHRYFLSKLTRSVSGLILFNLCYDELHKAYYIELVKRLCLIPVVFLHDMIPAFYPEYFLEKNARLFTHRINNALNITKGIICSSAAVVSTYETYAQQRYQPFLPRIVAPLGIGLSDVEHDMRPLLKSYFVVLGTIEPRKNHLLLLEVWRELISRMGVQTPQLVIIGKRGWKCEQVVNLIENSPVLKDFVIELSDCRDKMVVTYLKFAQALLFPSFMEGYGLPLIEAMSFKTPVIASDIPIFREIG